MNTKLIDLSIQAGTAIVPLTLWFVLDPITFWQRLTMLIIHIVVSLILYYVIMDWIDK